MNNLEQSVQYCACHEQNILFTLSCGLFLINLIGKLLKETLQHE